MWICYKDFESGFSKEKFWNKYSSSIDDLNEFYRESLKQKSGIIGVSLKQQTGDYHKTYPVNMQQTEIKHRFLGDEITLDTKTAVLNYKYWIGKAEGLGKIYFRTFDTSINSGS